jgi:hypothetical protein
VALLAVLASCGTSAASSGSATSATARGHCGPANASATALASGLQARVYSSHGGVYGCSFAVGRSFRLGNVARSIREARVQPVAVAGNDAAYGLSRFGVDTIGTGVVVRRLTDGKRLRESPATRAGVVEGAQSVGSVVVRSDGAVAWIGVERSIIGRGEAIEVHAANGPASGDRVLDSGAQIVPGSLQLRGSTLTWTTGAATRHATLR